MSAPLGRAILPTVRWRVIRTFTPAKAGTRGLIIAPHSRRDGLSLYLGLLGDFQGRGSQLYKVRCLAEWQFNGKQ
jgi:hypothetical protein